MKKLILSLVFSTFALAFAGAGLADHHGGGDKKMNMGKGMGNGLTPRDYMQIEQLYATYNWAIDQGDAEAWADTFVEDGQFNSFQGREQLESFINDTWVGNMNGTTRRHWNTNLHITGDGETAQGKVYLLLIDTSVQPPAIMTSASYSDELVKTDEGWRFKKRQTTSDRPAQ